MIKNTIIMMMIANEMVRPMISLLLYLFSSWLVSSEVILVLLSSMSLVTVGLGVIVSIGVLLTLLSFTVAGVWGMGVCGDNEVFGIVGDGAVVVACTVKQEKEY